MIEIMSAHGQFYTEDAKYIFQSMFLPDHSQYIEPFAGAGHLVTFIRSYYPDANVIQFDLEPNHPDIVLRDTLLDPPQYKDRYVVTNPPYLSRNKCNNKEVFDKYELNDLFKCFIKSMLLDPPDGGMLVLPLAFLTSIRPMDYELRRDFLTAFDILHINIFTEPVFTTTTYTIMSLQFIKRTKATQSTIPTRFFPSREIIELSLTPDNNYTVGGELYKLPVHPTITVARLTDSTDTNEWYVSKLNIYALDSTRDDKIRMTFGEESYVGTLSDRSLATLVFNTEIDESTQSLLCKRFNDFLNEKRYWYDSLFLPTYRNHARKRIPFRLVYRICGWLLLSIFP